MAARRADRSWLGLQIFETTGTDISDLGAEHGHRVLRVWGKGGKVSLVPLPPAVGRAIDRAADHRDSGQSCLTSTARGWTATPPPAVSGRSPRHRESGSPGHIPIYSSTRSSQPCSTRA